MNCLWCFCFKKNNIIPFESESSTFSIIDNISCVLDKKMIKEIYDEYNISKNNISEIVIINKKLIFKYDYS